VTARPLLSGAILDGNGDPQRSLLDRIVHAIARAIPQLISERQT
jgi:hypothetical protein